MSDENGTAEVRIKFGDGVNQHVSAATAEDILREFRREQPVRFGQALARSLVGPDSVKARANARK